MIFYLLHSVKTKSLSEIMSEQTLNKLISCWGYHILLLANFRPYDIPLLNVD